MAIIWAINVKDSIVDLIVFAAAIVYYGPGIFSLYKIRKNTIYIAKDITKIPKIKVISMIKKLTNLII